MKFSIRSVQFFLLLTNLVHLGYFIPSKNCILKNAFYTPMPYDVQYPIGLFHNIVPIRIDYGIYHDFTPVFNISFLELYDRIPVEVRVMNVPEHPKFNHFPVHRHPFVPDRIPFAGNVICNRDATVGSKYCGIRHEKQ